MVGVTKGSLVFSLTKQKKDKNPSWLPNQNVVIVFFFFWDDNFDKLLNFMALSH